MQNETKIPAFRTVCDVITTALTKTAKILLILVHRRTWCQGICIFHSRIIPSIWQVVHTKPWLREVPWENNYTGRFPVQRVVESLIIVYSSWYALLAVSASKHWLAFPIHGFSRWCPFLPLDLSTRFNESFFQGKALLLLDYTHYGRCLT